VEPPDPALSVNLAHVAFEWCWGKKGGRRWNGIKTSILILTEGDILV
jgi:hypothetical protein